MFFGFTVARSSPGHDEIAQRTVERDDQGAITSDETLVFGHDGHGSVRVLYDLAETLAGITNQGATFAAYGQLLAVHAANAALAGTSEAAFKSNLGYSGEQWDASLRMQNLRARAYDPRNGRFIGLDPFAGNMQDPQSLHKYAYVHGDPIQGIDPSGKFFGSVGGLLGGALFGQVGIGGGNAEDTPFYVHPWKSFPGYDKDGGIQGPDGLGLLRMSLWMNNDPQRAKSFLKAFQDEWGDLVTKAAAANDVPEGLVWASIFAEVVNFRYNDYIDIGDPLGASSFGPGQLSQATKRYYQTSARWNETMAGTDMTRGQMFKSQIASLDQLGQIKLPNYKRASDVAIITKQVYELSYVLSVQAKEVLLAAQGGGALALPTGGGITVDPMSANYLASNDAQGIFSQYAVGPDFHKNLPRLSIILVMMNRHHYRVTGGDGTEPYENRFTIQTPQAMFLKQAFQSGVLRFDGFKLKVQ